MRCLSRVESDDASSRGRNTLQHTATHCNTLQHTATHCNTLQLTATHCNTLQHTATHCNTLQHTEHLCYTMMHLLSEVQDQATPPYHLSCLSLPTLSRHHTMPFDRIMSRLGGGGRTRSGRDYAVSAESPTLDSQFLFFRLHYVSTLRKRL